MGLSTILNLFASSRYYTTGYSSTRGLGDALALSFGILIFGALLSLAIAAFMLIASWKIFVKMKERGWEALITGHNTYVIFDKINIHPLWIFGFAVAAIPFIGWIAAFVLYVVIMLRFCQGFGKSTGFAVLSILLPPVGIGILAFGSADWDASRINDGGTFAFLNYRKDGKTAGDASAKGGSTSAPKEDAWVSGEEK